MEIEQTVWFQTEVENLVSQAKQFQFTSQWDDVKSSHIAGMHRFHSESDVNKALKKANQLLKRKAY